MTDKFSYWPPRDEWLEQRRIAGMFSPVECTFCGRVYDLGTVTVTARYADCSVWTTPCCNRAGVDDRMFVSRPAIRHLRGTQ